MIGVNRDSAESHAKFQGELALPFPLLADTDEKLCKAFGVLVEREHEGKKFMGVNRETFLIDKDGVVRKIWRKVSPEDHANEVLSTVEELHL